MIEKKIKPSLVDYETQWTNEYIESEKHLKFAPYTPIEEIIGKLETEINAFVPAEFKEDYKTKSARFSFNRLYRNLIPHFKGWKVLYRNPSKNGNFVPLSKKFGYKPRIKKQSLKRTALTKKMCWTHDLYPLIGQVELTGANSCDNIAKHLNKQILNPVYGEFFQNFKQDLFSLHKTYKTFSQKGLNGLVLNYKDPLCQAFCDNIQSLNKYSQSMNSLIAKDYQVKASNISDLLQRKKTVKTAKGWRVQFLKD